jgi:hypothetical protein
MVLKTPIKIVDSKISVRRFGHSCCWSSAMPSYDETGMGKCPDGAGLQRIERKRKNERAYVKTGAEQAEGQWKM